MKFRIVRSIALLVTFVGSFGWAQLISGPTLDGLWASDGFRRVLEVQGDHVRNYEVTAVSCLFKWEVIGKVDVDGSIAFLQNGCLRRLVLKPATDTASLTSDCCVTDFLWHRLSEKPKGFGQKIENTPQKNYDIFWHTFAENYPFFALHQKNWNAIDQKYRPLVTAQTTPKELWDIFLHMVSGLHDAHVYLEAPDLKARWYGRRPDDPNHVGSVLSDDWKRGLEIVKTKYVPGLKDYGNDFIHFGMTEEGIAYLCINTFGAYVPGNVFADQKLAMDQAFDEIYQTSGSWKGLILDVRQNTGGFAGMDVWTATRLTGERYLAYTTETRDNLDGPMHFTPRQQIWVNPAARPGFLGKVVVLMGRDTVSSGENTVMSLMGRKPAVVKIGENTQGVFSEILERVLPNGWKFGLPDQIGRTAEGKAFDVVGIPPDIPVPVLTPQELKEGRDSCMEKAIEMIMK